MGGLIGQWIDPDLRSRTPADSSDARHWSTDQPLLARSPPRPESTQDLQRQKRGDPGLGGCARSAGSAPSDRGQADAPVGRWRWRSRDPVSRPPNLIFGHIVGHNFGPVPADSGPSGPNNQHKTAVQTMRGRPERLGARALKSHSASASIPGRRRSWSVAGGCTPPLTCDNAPPRGTESHMSCPLKAAARRA